MCIYHILPWPEHLLRVSAAHEGAQEGGAKGCHHYQMSPSPLRQSNVGRFGGQAFGWTYFGLESVKYGGEVVGHWGKLRPTWSRSGGPVEVAPIHDQTWHQEGILILKCYQ